MATATWITFFKAFFWSQKGVLYGVKGCAAAQLMSGVILRPSTNPHQQITEGHIGEQLPFADDGMQMINRPAGEHGVLGEQVTESGHG